MDKKVRNRLEPEELFIKSVKDMIRNMFIDNPNLENDYYFEKCDILNTIKLIKDNKKRAKYILDEIDEISHLVLWK